MNFLDLWGLVSAGLQKAFEKFEKVKYIKKSDVKEGDPTYQCDDYVQDVINGAGYKSSDYLSGDSQQKNVQDHIDNAETKGVQGNKKAEAPNLMKDSEYVVFMNESKYGLDPHAGIVTIDSSGKVTFTHNSSNNPNKGVLPEKYENLQAFQNDFGYDKFYYQKLKNK